MYDKFQVCQDEAGEDREDGGGDDGDSSSGNKTINKSAPISVFTTQAYMDCYELCLVQKEEEIAQIFARR